MISREIFKFLIVGLITVLIDFFIYRTLVGFEFLNTNKSKVIGFLTGSLFSYTANRVWTFKDSYYASYSYSRFIILYISTLLINVLVNMLSLNFFSNIKNSILLAFIFATATSAGLNFLGMKFIVFKSKKI